MLEVEGDTVCLRDANKVPCAGIVPAGAMESKANATAPTTTNSQVGMMDRGGGGQGIGFILI